MKTFLAFLLVAAVAQAASTSNSSYSTTNFSVAGPNYDLSFRISWWSDDYPQNSAPGLLEVLDGGGNFVGRIVASTYRDSGDSVSLSGSGSVDGVSSGIGRYAPNGTPADGALSGTWHLNGLTPGTYTVRLWRYETYDSLLSATTVVTDTELISGSEPPGANTPPNAVLLSPGAQAVTAGTTLSISSRATDPDGNLVAHNLDIQRPAGDWNFQGGFATGEPFQGGPVGSAGDSTRTASFTFSDPGTYTIRSGASDGSGWYHSETVTITVVPAAPTQYALTVAAGPGGAVSNGGTFVAGAGATVSATPDAAHDFAGWTGDAGGTANPLTVLMDRDKSVQAVFTLKSFALFTSATTGGAVTQGGTYPPGTTVTVSAVPDAMHRFVGWAGDAGGTLTTVTVLLDGPKSVQAVFTDKTSQTLSFPAPADQPVAAPPLTLNATASSGLVVSYTVLSGPAVLNGNQLQITGPGAVTVEARQPGDGFYLSAPPVIRTFNTFAVAVLRYRPSGRTILQSRSANSAAPYVLETP